MSTLNLPEELEHITIDEAAYCLDLSPALHCRLLSLMPADTDVPPPSEYSDEPDSANRRSRYLSKRWSDLTEEEQAEIARAVREDSDAWNART